MKKLYILKVWIDSSNFIIACFTTAKDEDEAAQKFGLYYSTNGVAKYSALKIDGSLVDVDLQEVSEVLVRDQTRIAISRALKTSI